jgi:hypothetical protein
MKKTQEAKPRTRKSKLSHAPDKQQAVVKKLKQQLSIEAALERVRVRAMALRQSADLNKVIAVVFREMGKLGFDLYDSNIVIWDRETNDLTYYGSGLGGVNMPPPLTVPHLPNHHPFIDGIYQDLRKRKKYRSVLLVGKPLKDFHRLLITRTDVGNAPKAYLKEMMSVKSIVLSYATMEHGLIEVASSESLPDDKVGVRARTCWPRCMLRRAVGRGRASPPRPASASAPPSGPAPACSAWPRSSKPSPGPTRR